MRLVVSALIIVTFMTPTIAAAGRVGNAEAAPVATPSTAGCHNDPYGDRVDCGGAVSDTTSPMAPSISEISQGSPGQPALPPPSPVPILEGAPGGGECLTQTTNPAATTPAEVAYLNVLIKNLQVAYSACPPTPPGVAAPAVDPATLAEEFWQTIPLPVPKPAIPPGYAITGKPAYLVTDGTVSPASFVEPTPLGLLTVTAHGTYTVDWGDGSSGGPYTSESTGYPTGQIVHTYDRTGTVDVALHEAWTATWTLGAAAGTLGQLATQATIPGFAVRQIQAVIEN
jgi:hypothetical protein